jgi:hypothetical protein
MGTPEGSTEHHTLLENAVSLGGDWVASVANVAPSSSVAFTLALLVAFSGLASPLAVLVAGIGMLLVRSAIPASTTGSRTRVLPTSGSGRRSTLFSATPPGSSRSSRPPPPTSGTSRWPARTSSG